LQNLIIQTDRSLISLGNVKESHILFDMDSLFVMGTITIHDPSGQLIQEFRLGTPVTMVYSGDNNKPTLKTSMKVLSCKKEPTSEPALMDRVVVSLIGDWYYSQDVTSRGYFGSVSKIVKDVFTKPEQSGNAFTNVASALLGLDSSASAFKVFKLDNSTDSPRIRYQLKEGPAAFLSRLRKYAVMGESPMFLYANRNKELVLKAQSSIESSSPRYRIIPMYDAKEIAKPKAGLPVLQAFTLMFGSEAEHAANTIEYEFQKNNIPYRDQASMPGQLNVSSIENREGLLAVTSTDHTIADWEISPAEAAAISINENAKMQQSLFYAVAVVGNIAETAMDIGTVVMVDTNTAAKEDGYYYVKHMDVFFNEGNNYTKLLLIRIKGA